MNNLKNPKYELKQEKIIKSKKNESKQLNHKKNKKNIQITKSNLVFLQPKIYSKATIDFIESLPNKPNLLVY